MKLLARLIQILSGVQTGAGQEISRLEQFAHFCVLAGKSFVRNRCPVRAAALSYATLFALIPMLAVAIGVTSSILKDQGEKEIYTAIDKLISSIMPPATAKTDSHGTSLSLSPIAITLTPTNSVVVQSDGKFRRQHKFICRRNDEQSRQRNARRQRQRAKGGGEKHP